MKSLRAIIALIIREMISTYGRHFFGYAWAILEPVCGIALMSIVFSIAFRAPALGDNFPLFYASGLLPFFLWSDISSKISSSISFSKQLLFYPPIKYIHAIIARFIINIITHVLVFVIVMTGICYIFDYQAHLVWSSMISSILMASSLALGVGTLNCYATTRFPTWDKIWSIANRPAFIISGILFLYDNVPEPYKTYLWYNPLVHVVGEMRSGFYPSYEAFYVSYLYIYGLSLVTFLIGLIFLNRHSKDLLVNL